MTTNLTERLNLYDEEVKAVFPSDETIWATFASWTLETAKELSRCLASIDDALSIKYSPGVIRLKGSRNYYYLRPRRAQKTGLLFFEKEEKKRATLKTILDRENVSYVQFYKNWGFDIVLDKEYISRNEAMFKEIHKIMLS